MVDSPESTLAWYEHCRNLGNWLLIGGLALEVLIVAFVPERRKCKRLKRGLEVLAALIVFGGVGVEVMYGRKVDRTGDEIRRAAKIRVAELELRTEALKKGSWKFAEQMVAPNLWVRNAEDKVRLKVLGVRLDSFPGTQLFIQAVPDFRMQLLADNLADLFRREHKWNVRVVDEATTNFDPKEIALGIRLYLWRGGSMIPEPSDFDDNPTWIAADLLSEYLPLFLGLTWPMIVTTSGLNSGPSCELNGPVRFALPENGILLTIGMIDMDSLWSLLSADRELERKVSSLKDGAQ